MFTTYTFSTRECGGLILGGFLKISDLRIKLGSSLKSAEAVRPPQGLPTAYQELNQFLLWGGFPQGGLSLLRAAHGFGATALWVSAARKLTQEKKWVCWLSPSQSLYPLTLQLQGLDLSFLWTAHQPFADKSWLWVLQELMNSELFSFIGCDLAENNFRARQWLKLQKQAQSAQVAIVFLQRKNFSTQSPHCFSLIMEFNQHHINIQRALHRSTPMHLSWRNLHAHFMPQLTPISPASDGRDLSRIRSTPSLQQQTEGKFF